MPWRKRVRKSLKINRLQEQHSWEGAGEVRVGLEIFGEISAYIFRCFGKCAELLPRKGVG